MASYNHLSLMFDIGLAGSGMAEVQSESELH